MGDDPFINLKGKEKKKCRRSHTHPGTLIRLIRCVWLRAKPKRFSEGDSAELRNQLFALIQQIDEKWSEKPKWDQSSREMLKDLSAFPIVSKYIDFVKAFPRREPIEREQDLNQKYPDRRWIAFPNRGGAYTLDEMLAPLLDRLIKTKSDERYKDICKHVGLNECYLLVHYDFDAYAYNTPIDVPNSSFQNIAEFALRLQGDVGFFQNIFLLNCLDGREEAYSLL